MSKKRKSNARRRKQRDMQTINQQFRDAVDNHDEHLTLEQREDAHRRMIANLPPDDAA